jgi:hypothetical protein
MQCNFSALFLALAVSQPPPNDTCYYETANFTVYAESDQTARKVGDAAELHRLALAKLWYGKELRDWPTRCRIDVNLTDRPGGVTDISYSQERVLFQRVGVRGSLAGTLKGPLPHELSHVLFAHHFGQQPPRWADEGGAILFEAEVQQSAHRKRFREILDRQRQFPLRQLLGMRQYPPDIPCLYAQGHSLSGFLVAAKGHKVFLAFVRDGLDGSWDQAVKSRYGYDDVEQLEKAWLVWARKPPEPAPDKKAGKSGSISLRQRSAVARIWTDTPRLNRLPISTVPRFIHG